MSVRATGRVELAVDVVAVQEATERGRALLATLREVLLAQEEGHVAGCVAGVLVLDPGHILGRDPVQRDVGGLARLPSSSVEEGALGGAEILADLRGGPRHVARLLDAGHR